MKIYSDEALEVDFKKTNQKVLAKEGRLKDTEAGLNNTSIPKQRKKILPASRGEMGEDIPTTGCEWGKNILEQNMGTKSS